jgi:hypothetical protein
VALSPTSSAGRDQFSYEPDDAVIIYTPGGGKSKR